MSSDQQPGGDPPQATPPQPPVFEPVDEWTDWYRKITGYYDHED